MSDVTVNPMVVDGVLTVTDLARPIRVKKVYWFNPTTSGDDFTITDGSSGANVLLEGQSEANNQSQNFDFDPPPIWKNFAVPTLTSGTLYIYH
jgi:hypothetical protein